MQHELLLAAVKQGSAATTTTTLGSLSIGVVALGLMIFLVHEGRLSIPVAFICFVAGMGVGGGVFPTLVKSVIHIGTEIASQFAS